MAYSWSNDPRLSILILTEDSGKSAGEIVEELSRRILKQRDEGTQTHRIKFEHAEQIIRRACSGTTWKSTKVRDRRLQVLLLRKIATKLAEDEPGGFVFFHVDGDTAWSRRADVGKFEQWAGDRASLDEVEKPKDLVCLGSQFNDVLARDGYPTADVVAAGTSLHTVVDKLLQCEALLDALRSTYETAPAEPH